MSTPQHPARPATAASSHEVTTEDLLAALLPDTPAAAARPEPPAQQSVPDVAHLLQLAREQGAFDAQQPPAAPVPDSTPAPAGPLVPRWAIGTAVASVGVGAGAVLLGWATSLLAAGVAAVAAGIAAAAPMLLVGLVLVAALLGRRKASASVHITQTFTQHIRTGGRR